MYNGIPMDESSYTIILSKAFSEFENLNDIKQLPDLELTEYKQCIKREHRNNWRRKLREVIEEQKSILLQRVDLLDPYCAGKIVAETIREYDKNLSANAILKAIDTFADKN